MREIKPRSRTALWPALVAAPLAGIAVGVAYSALLVDHDDDLPPALPGGLSEVATPSGRVALYGESAGPLTPLLLIHSINAAASAYEVRPLFLRYRGSRPVYALDLPGFGRSERPERVYTPRVMTDAILAAAERVAERHGGTAIDTIALSLGCEYLARAALEKPHLFRSLGFVSPTGFDAALSGEGRAGSDRGHRLGLAAISVPLWSRALFDLVVSRRSMRFFLEKTWGGRDIDEGLLDYGHRAAHRPGAQHAPWSFLAGYLFADDVSRLYRLLELPVWSAHGVRGDFTDFRYEEQVRERPNWSVATFDTGAFPHFERLDAVTRSYDAFLATIARGRR